MSQNQMIFIQEHNTYIDIMSVDAVFVKENILATQAKGFSRSNKNLSSFQVSITRLAQDTLVKNFQTRPSAEASIQHFVDDITSHGFFISWLTHFDMWVIADNVSTVQIVTRGEIQKANIRTNAYDYEVYIKFNNQEQYSVFAPTIEAAEIVAQETIYALKFNRGASASNTITVVHDGGTSTPVGTVNVGSQILATFNNNNMTISGVAPIPKHILVSDWAVFNGKYIYNITHPFKTEGLSWFCVDTDNNSVYMGADNQPGNLQLQTLIVPDGRIELFVTVTGILP